MKTQTYKIVPAFSFDFLTPFYDAITELLGFGNSFKKKVLALVRVNREDKLLDVGCGTGTFLLLVKQQHPQVSTIGLDPDERVSSIAKRKLKNAGLSVEFVQGLAEQMTFKDASFNVVVSILVFHHLPTEIKKQAMKEIYRVLKMHGQFLLVDFGKPKNKLWKFLFWLEGLFEEGKYIKDNLEGKLPFFLKEAGFIVEEAAPRYRNVQFLLARKGVSD